MKYRSRKNPMTAEERRQYDRDVEAYQARKELERHLDWERYQLREEEEAGGRKKAERRRNPPPCEIMVENPSRYRARSTALSNPRVVQSHTPTGRKIVVDAVVKTLSSLAEQENRAFYQDQWKTYNLGFPGTAGQRSTDSSVAVSVSPRGVFIRPQNVNIITKSVPLKGTAEEVAQEAAGWIRHFAAKPRTWANHLPIDTARAQATAWQRNPAPGAIALSLLPYVTKALGDKVTSFNALPVSERKARLRTFLQSKRRWGMGVAGGLAAPQIAKSDMALSAIVHAIERHGSEAVAEGSAAAARHLEKKNPRRRSRR